MHLFSYMHSSWKYLEARVAMESIIESLKINPILPKKQSNPTVQLFLTTFRITFYIWNYGECYFEFNFVTVTQAKFSYALFSFVAQSYNPDNVLSMHLT